MILITIFEYLCPVTVLEPLLKGALVVLLLSENQLAETVFLALLPVANITNTILVELSSLAVLESLHELSHVD